MLLKIMLIEITILAQIDNLFMLKILSENALSLSNHMKQYLEDE